MRKSFPGYYQPTQDEFDQLWNSCIFVFDANVLLNFYRYTPDTCNNLFSILERLSDRIWIPHQAAFEYQKNRLNVISEQRNKYNEYEKRLKSSLTSFENLQHPYLDQNRINEIISDTEDKFIDVIKEAKGRHPDLLVNDVIRERITSIFEGKIGQPYSGEQLKKLQKEAEERIQNTIPPGYQDAKKDGKNKYGDVIIWFQIIDFVKSTSRPIILITDDSKEDWWLKHEGKTISPRPELIQEMEEKTGLQIYIYQTDQFMKFVSQFLRIEEKTKAIEEVSSIREEDELKQKQYIEMINALQSKILDNQWKDLGFSRGFSSISKEYLNELINTTKLLDEIAPRNLMIDLPKFDFALQNKELLDMAKLQQTPIDSKYLDFLNSQMVIQDMLSKFDPTGSRFRELEEGKDVEEKSDDNNKDNDDNDELDTDQAPVAK